MDTTKFCSRCQQYLPATTQYFSKVLKDKDRLQGYCKACYKKYHKDKYQKTPSIDIQPPKKHINEQSSINTDLPDIQKEPIFIAERSVVIARTSLANKSAHDRASRYLVRYAIGKIPAEDMYLKIQLQEYKCMYCKNPISFHTCHIDHVNPLAKDGEHYLYNIALTCSLCNLTKRDRTLKRFCERMKFDYMAIKQELADINHRLHILVFGEDWYKSLDDVA